MGGLASLDNFSLCQLVILLAF